MASVESLTLFTFWETSFTFGGPKSLMVITSLFIDLAGDIPFHKPYTKATFISSVLVSILCSGFNNNGKNHKA